MTYEGGFLNASIATTSCARPTMKPRKPNSAARNTPNIATVKAFLSVVCLSNHRMTLFAGGGLTMISCSFIKRSPQKTYSKSLGNSRIYPSKFATSRLNPFFRIILLTNLLDFLSWTGNSTSYIEQSVSNSSCGGSVPLSFIKLVMFDRLQKNLLVNTFFEPHVVRFSNSMSELGFQESRLVKYSDLTSLAIKEEVLDDIARRNQCNVIPFL